MAVLNARGLLVAGILAAIGASCCCAVPLMLLTLGLGGVWIGSLPALEPYRPIFIGLTVLFLGLAFRKLYLTRQACTLGAPCADPVTVRWQRIVFWLVSILLLGLLAVPWLAPLFY